MVSAKGTKGARCAHVLGDPVDLDKTCEEIEKYKRQVAAGVLAVAVMLALNWMILQGAGSVLLLAPVGWTLWGYREMRYQKVYLSKVKSSRR